MGHANHPFLGVHARIPRDSACLERGNGSSIQAMPLITGVDHDHRTVGVVAIGTVTPSNVRDHMLHRRREQSLRYPELVDARGAAIPSTADDIQEVAELMREMSREGPLGSIAIIVSS